MPIEDVVKKYHGPLEISVLVWFGKYLVGINGHSECASVPGIIDSFGFSIVPNLLKSRGKANFCTFDIVLTGNESNYNKMG